MEEYSQLNWNDHSAVLLSKLHNMFETNAFVDLTLVSDEGLSIQVHRVILCAASQYFQDLLSQHPADTHTTIILSDVSFEHLRALVEFIYKGTVSVPRSQLPVLLESATSMKIEGLADAIKCSQKQHDTPAETNQPESEETLLKIVSVKSITQMPSQAGHQSMSCEKNDVVVKEELDWDSDVNVAYEPEENNCWEALDFSVVGYQTPPAPIVFKRDLSMAEEEKEHQENIHWDDDMHSQELAECDFDENGAGHDAKKSNVSTDKNGATGPTSNKLNTTVHSITNQKQKVQSTVRNGLFNCDACGLIYKLKRTLSMHVKYECGKEPSFSCPLCNHRTALKSSLKKHLVRVHKMNDSQLASHGLGPKIHQEMPFKCHQCKRSYKRKGDLNRHVKDECGVNPRFQCTLCDYRAKQKIHLRDHLTTVHDISPDSFAAHGVGYAFQCNICLYCCGQKTAFKKHMTTEHAE